MLNIPTKKINTTYTHKIYIKHAPKHKLTNTPPPLHKQQTKKQMNLINITKAITKNKNLNHTWNIQRTKQQLNTPNATHTTLTNHTNKQTNPNTITPPLKNTRKYQNKNTQQHQTHKNNQNNLKRARPTDPTQSKTTKIRKDRNRKHQHKTTYTYEQTHKRNTKYQNHIFHLNLTKNHNKEQRTPKHIEREYRPTNITPYIHLIITPNKDRKSQQKTNLKLKNTHKVKINTKHLRKAINTYKQPKPHKTQKSIRKHINISYATPKVTNHNINTHLTKNSPKYQNTNTQHITYKNHIKRARPKPNIQNKKQNPVQNHEHQPST